MSMPRTYTPEQLERRRQRCREWHARHRVTPEYKADNVARSAKWRLEHPEEYRAQMRAWRAANREYKQSENRRWAAANPDKMYIVQANAQHARRSQKAGGRVTKYEWDSIKEYFGHRCAYCLKPSGRLEMEHVVALASGGAHEPGNVVPACRSCNARKHSRGILYMIGKAA